MSSLARPRHWFYRIPVAGWIARDLIHGDEDNIWYFLAMIVSLAGIATLIWGLPALVLMAKVAVPVCFVLLILITRG